MLLVSLLDINLVRNCKKQHDWRIITSSNLELGWPDNLCLCVITVASWVSEDNDGPGLTVFMFASNYKLKRILALTMFGHRQTV